MTSDICSSVSEGMGDTLLNLGLIEHIADKDEAIRYLQYALFVAGLTWYWNRED